MPRSVKWIYLLVEAPDDASGNLGSNPSLGSQSTFAIEFNLKFDQVVREDSLNAGGT